MSTSHLTFPNNSDQDFNLFIHSLKSFLNLKVLNIHLESITEQQILGLKSHTTHLQLNELNIQLDDCSQQTGEALIKALKAFNVASLNIRINDFQATIEINPDNNRKYQFRELSDQYAQHVMIQEADEADEADEQFNELITTISLETGEALAAIAEGAANMFTYAWQTSRSQMPSFPSLFASCSARPDEEEYETEQPEDRLSIKKNQ